MRRLTAPRYGTWLVAVILAALGFLVQYGVIGSFGISAFWLVAIAFIILFLGTLLRGL